jgi:microcystin-dependent protein
MSDYFIGEIRVVGFDFAPRGWATCNGQLLPISQNTALFSLLGVNYGGDGRTTFALPNFAGKVPVHMGQGQGLSDYGIGEDLGEPYVTLLSTEMPQHTHAVQAVADVADLQAPAANRSLAKSAAGFAYDPAAPNALLAPQTILPAGGSQPHNNYMPTLTLTFIIALQGIYPPRQ